MRKFKLDTQLLIASKESKMNIELIKELLSQGADINYLDNYNNSVFHNICFNKGITLDILKLCVKNYGANFNIVGRDNRTALHMLCYNSNASLDCIKFAINNGANINVLDRFKNTPFHYICITRAENLLGFLKFFVKRYKGVFNVINQLRETLFYYLCKNKNISPKELQFALKNGADIHWENQYKNTPFHIICSNPNISIELLQFFLERDASFNTEGRDGRKPSDRLFENKQLTVQILEFAINNGAFLNNIKGKPKFIYSAKINIQCLRLSILRGAKVKIPVQNVVHKFEKFMQMIEVYLITHKQYDVELRKPFVEIEKYNSDEIIKFCVLQNFHITKPSVKFYFSCDMPSILCTFGLNEKGDSVLKSSKKISEIAFQELASYLNMEPSRYNYHVLQAILFSHPVNSVKTLCSLEKHSELKEKAMCIMLLRHRKDCAMYKVPKMLILNILNLCFLYNIENMSSL